MKTRFYLLFLCFILSSSSWLDAQTCFPNGAVVFNSQNDIDDFSEDNNGCTEIGANVIINSANVTNLDGLSEVTSIGGNLVITGTGLTDLSGLDDLEEIGGNLFIDANNNLVDLEGLGSLLKLNGFLSISFNPSLVDLAGVDNLESFGSGILILDNLNLESLAGISYPKTLPGFQLFDNPKVTDLSPLLGVDTITGAVEIEEMTRIKDLSGFDSVKVIQGNLFINNNDSLVNFTGLTKLNTVTGNFVVRNHAQLVDFSGMDSLERIGGLVEVLNNASLLNFSGLQSLKKIEGSSVTITQNDTLLSLSGMASLDSILADVEISFNPFLRSLDGLNQLKYVQDLEINNNDSLKEVTALNNLLIIDGAINISNNESLESLWGFNNLDVNLITSLFIKDNITLSECQAFSICEYLEFNVIPGNNIDGNAVGCDTVPEVEALCLSAPLPVEMLYFTGELKDRVSHLQWATESEYNNDGFAIERSAEGRDWSEIGFVNGQGNSNEITIYHFKDQQPLSGENYYRLRQINYNGSFDYSEVIVLRNESDKLELSVYPNPSDDVVNVSVNNPEQAEVQVTVQDYLGRVIYQTTLDAQSNWNQSFQFDTKGMYFVTLRTEQQWYHEKVIYTGGQ